MTMELAAQDATHRKPPTGRLSAGKQQALLASLGAVPFVGCAVLTLAGFDSAPLVGSVTRTAAVYGVVIASFMAGVHWGTYLYNADTAPTNLFFTSNAVAIFVWLCFLLAGVQATLVALISVFGFLLAIDSALYRRRLICSAYFKTRCAVTGVVIASLIATLA